MSGAILTVRGSEIAAIWQGPEEGVVFGGPCNWRLVVTLTNGAKLVLTYDHDEFEWACDDHYKLYAAMKSGEMARVGALP